jgi:methylmalonyl-CoA/ethylmalonyl-CoA epimerase
MPDLSQSRIGQIAIVCQDVGRATTFYRDALGLRFLFAAGPTLAFFDAGGTRLMLSTGEGEHDHPGSMLYFFIKDIEGTCEELARRGVAFIDKPHMIAKMPDHDLWLAAFRDTEGNTMAVMEEKR